MSYAVFEWPNGMMAIILRPPGSSGLEIEIGGARSGQAQKLVIGGHEATPHSRLLVPEVAVTGFILPKKPGDGGFDTVAYSSLGDSRMEIRRLGAVPSLIEPSWANRAINDPAVLGLTALLALAVALVELTQDLRQLLKQRSDAPSGQAGVPAETSHANHAPPDASSKPVDADAS